MLRSLSKSDFKPKKQEFEVLGHMMVAINESYSNSLSIVVSVTYSSLLIWVSCSMHLYNQNKLNSWQELQCFLKEDHAEGEQDKGNFVFFII